MALRIGIVSQKGGVGKSTLARLLAVEYARHGWNVKIADLDISQATSYHWHTRRLQHGVEPEIAVEQFSRVTQALRVADHYDLFILDGPPHARQGTLEIARNSDLVILPTGMALDDLEPTVRLAHELQQSGVSETKMGLVLCRVGDSQAEIEEATNYLRATGYYLFAGMIPERVAYRRASDTGRAIIETPYPTLNQKADQVVQAMIDRLAELERK